MRISALLLTLPTAISTLLGGWIAVRAHRRLHVLLGFGAGVLLGATFFDLLPEAAEIAQSRAWSMRLLLAPVVAGFLLFYVAQRFLMIHVCPTGDCEREAHRHLGRLSAIGLIAHSTIDGASIAAATLVSWKVGLIVAVGIMAHDMSDGLNTMLLVTHGEAPHKGDYVFLAADALAPVVGGALIVVSGISQLGLAFFLALTSGFFLYTATADLLPEAHRRAPGWIIPLATCAGVIFIGVVVRIISMVA